MAFAYDDLEVELIKLRKSLDNAEDEIDSLEYKLDDANGEIYELNDEISALNSELMKAESKVLDFLTSLGCNKVETKLALEHADPNKIKQYLRSVL